MVGSLGLVGGFKAVLENGDNARIPAISIAKILLSADPSLINFPRNCRIFGSVNHRAAIGKNR